MKPKYKLIYKILNTKFYHFYLALIIFFLLGSAVILKVEPGISSYGDAMWFSFVAMSTIGFGDVVVVTTVGRITAAFLSILAIFVVALTTGVIASFYSDILRMRAQKNVSENEELTNLLERMENLSELSKEELVEVSDKVKMFRNKNRRG